MGSVDKELRTDLSQLKYVFFSTNDEHLVRADYGKAVATGGAMLAGLQQGYADALSSSSGAVYFQDSMGFMYDWGKNVRSGAPVDWDQMRSEMMAALTAGDFSKLIPSYPFDRYLKEDGSLGIASYPLQHGSLELDGLTRNYYYYVPSSYDGKTPVPLVFSFHGIQQRLWSSRALTKLKFWPRRKVSLSFTRTVSPYRKGRNPAGQFHDRRVSGFVEFYRLWHQRPEFRFRFD